MRKALKRKKFCKIDRKIEFMSQGKRFHYFRRNPNPFSLDCIEFLLYLLKFYEGLVGAEFSVYNKLIKLLKFDVYISFILLSEIYKICFVEYECGLR